MSRKLKRFKNDGDRSLKTMVESKDPEIVYTIVDSIFCGLDNDISAVECFEVESPSSIVTFKMAKVEWSGCLTKCLDDMIIYEDYEMCTKIQGYRKKLDQKYIGDKKDI